MRDLLRDLIGTHFMLRSNRLTLWWIASLCISLRLASAIAAAADRPRNFVVILVDDLGYGDIGPYGSELNRTPQLDRMAEQGRKFTNFYVAASVCTPSRAALMTGCYAQRVDMGLNALPETVNNIVFFPGEPKGLNPHEVTIAEMLQNKGYATACIGKWHLGDQPQFLPTQNGFEDYFGIPFSNDMGFDNAIPYPPLPLLRNENVIEQEPDQRYFTKRFTEEAIAFIEQHKEAPFFVYLPHTMVHWPHYASPGFKGQSRNGVYGDVVEEIDWSVGQILDTLMEWNLAEQTLVIFTSDNGGARARECVVSNLPLRAGKGTMCEGGFRVPMLAWQPGTVPAGTVCDELTTAMDLLPTFAEISRAELPQGRALDGRSIVPLLHGENGAKTPHEAFFYRRGIDLYAVRSGDWKLYVKTTSGAVLKQGQPQRIPAGTLYNLKSDIGETTDVAAEHPDVVARLQTLAKAARVDIGDGVEHPGENVRRAAYIDLADADTLTHHAEGFVPIFNGRNLNGWEKRPADSPSTWNVVDGVIRGEGKEDRQVFLVYSGDDKLKDFELKFEYKMVTNGNTGVELRARPDVTGQRLFEGYHADLGHVGIGDHILGAWDFHFGKAQRDEPACVRGTDLTIEADGRLTVREIEDAVQLSDIDAHDWNRVHVIAQNNRFEFFINGKPASKFTDKFESYRLDQGGSLALQIHDDEMIVEFREIYLKRL